MDTAQTRRPPAQAVQLGVADEPGRLARLVASLAICMLLIGVGATILISMVTSHA